MKYVNPGELFVQKFGVAEDSDDVLRYANFLREEAGLSTDPPIDLRRVYARFGMPTPKRALLPNQQGLLLNPERGIVLIKEDDPEARQRFTEAHELMEYLFSALPSGKGWAARQTGIFKPNIKEQLCNEGAAELLMPRVSFVPRLYRIGISFKAGRELGEDFHVSTTAALVHMARVGPGHHAVVLWRVKNKPTEIKAKVSPNQISLFGQKPEEIHPKKLRVEWSLGGPNVPYIPPNKSIQEDTSIYAAWEEGEFTVGKNNLDLGSAKGVFKSENQPFEAHNERFVISLLHFPSDTDCPTPRIP